MSLLRRQNTKYNLVIFDFDGTIADSSAGILDAHRYTMKKYGISEWTDEHLRELIGGNLLDIYMNSLGLDIEMAREAVRVYRDRYAKVGIKMATLYPKCVDVLQKLKDNGYKVAIATLKADSFVKEMVVDLSISEYFDCIYGMTDRDDLSKADLIRMCIKNTNVNAATTLFVGDSKGDLVAANEVETGFVGVTYGFGFRKEIANNIKAIHNIIELIDVVGIK